MDIYLTEVSNSKSSLTFPTLPETIRYAGSANYQTYSIISNGTVKIPKGTDVSTITWNGVFFGSPRKKHKFIRQWKEPKQCKSILCKWRDEGTILRLLVTDTSINSDVTISSFSYEEMGACGDYSYSIAFSCVKELKVYTTNELKIEAYKKVDRPAAKTGGTYTVVKGDSLWRIAQNKLGNGTRWKEIYNLNKDIIEKTAKKYGRSSSSNGHWIYPGDVFTLPVK